MKHLYLFTAILLITASQQCTAMENKIPISEPNILVELTTVKKPYVVACFPGNLVAIVGQDGCSLCNYSTNTEITKICTLNIPYGRVPYITPHPNKKVFALGQYTEKLIVYNIETKKIWETKLSMSSPPVFNPADNTILTQQDYNRKITVFNYKNKSHKSYSLEQFDVKLSTFHPTKQNLCLSHKSCTASILTWNDCLFSEQTIIRKRANSFIQECQYSPDGSLIVIVTNPRGLNILDPESNTEKPLAHNKNYSIWAMVFYPASFILAALSAEPHAICYWNTKTRQLITTTPLTSSNGSFYQGNRMDFTRDGGTKLIVALKDKCIVLEIPFEVRYKDITKDNAIFTYWILKNYQQQHGNTIPDEIIHLLTNNLLEASQYSLTNY